jgi:hypothetical protein
MQYMYLVPDAGIPSELLPAFPGNVGRYRAWRRDQWTANREPCEACLAHPPRLWTYRYQHPTDPDWREHTDTWVCGWACWRILYPGWQPKKPPAPPDESMMDVLWEIGKWGGLCYLISRIF